MLKSLRAYSCDGRFMLRVEDDRLNAAYLRRVFDWTVDQMKECQHPDKIWVEVGDWDFWVVTQEASPSIVSTYFITLRIPMPEDTGVPDTTQFDVNWTQRVVLECAAACALIFPHPDVLTLYRQPIVRKFSPDLVKQWGNGLSARPCSPYRPSEIRYDIK